MSDNRIVPRARARPDVVKARIERVAVIAQYMRELRWVRGETARALAAEWGLERGTVENYAAEASRIVAREVVDVEHVHSVVGVALERTIRDAMADGDRRSVIDAAVITQSDITWIEKVHIHLPRLKGPPCNARR